MTQKYSFGYPQECAVEIPELDAFLKELRALFDKYDCAFKVEHDYDEPPRLIFAPAESMDLEIFVEYLSYADAGVPWLDSARARFEAAKQAWYLNKRKREEETKLAAAEGRRRAEAARERVLLEQGMVVGGKKYRLIEDKS